GTPAGCWPGRTRTPPSANCSLQIVPVPRSSALAFSVFRPGFSRCPWFPSYRPADGDNFRLVDASRISCPVAVLTLYREAMLPQQTVEMVERQIAQGRWTLHLSLSGVADYPHAG